MYKFLIRPILFLLPAESAHNVTIWLSGLCKGPLAVLVRKIFKFENSALEQNLFGLNFKNPVGLGAGMDKYAKVLHFWPLIGFGFVEVGGVTPKAQDGNPKPRVFRLKEDKSIINRFGLNNAGALALAEKLSKNTSSVPLGVNISKNESTPNEKALDDYLFCLENLHSKVDFIVFNVSCPNSSDVDKLQEENSLMEMLKTLKNRLKELNSNKALLVKIGPDLEDYQIEYIAKIVKEVGINGIIATNTSVLRKNLKTSAEEIEKIGRGGLSGQSLTGMSTQTIKKLAKACGGQTPIIGVGGIASAEQAYEKIRAGASLLQIYTGLVYEGPSLIKNINKELVNLLKRDGFSNIREAIGVDI